jgi:hypothetical protein
MKIEIENYLAAIANDYAKWTNLIDSPDENDKRNSAALVSGFCAGLTIEEGSKYIKVISGAHGQRSVHSFIVKKDDGKFKAGDILKAASWAAPAKNFSRGNVLTGNFGSVRWTGAQ